MPLINLIDSYSPVGDILSLITCLTLQIVIYGVLNFEHSSNFSCLKKSLEFIELSALSNVFFWYACQKSLPDIFIILSRTIYHIAMMLCLFEYLLYIKRMLKVSGTVIKFMTYFTNAFFAVSALAELTANDTGFGLHSDKGLWYDPLINGYTVFYVYSVLLMFIMLVAYASRLIKSVRYCLIAAETIVIAVMVYEGFTNTNTFTSFTYLLPVFVVMILLHSKPFDDKTGALSADSFASFTEQAFRKKSSVDYMVLKLNLNRTKFLPSELGKVLNSFWHNYFKNAFLFNIEHDTYVLAVPHSGRNGDTESKIRELLDTKFRLYYSQFNLEFKVAILLDIDFVQSDTEFKEIINYIFRTTEDNSMIISDDEMRERLRLIKSIHENLIDIAEKNNLDDPRVLVYCQPIRNMKTGRFDTAEALMRMSIPEKDFLTPNLFIPVAEDYGYIHTLTDIMLNKVCRQIKELENEGFAFNRVSVNFTASDMLKDDFCDKVLNIVSSNNIAPSKIGIELTESQNENDFRIIKEKIDRLRSAGMTLYLDDIGTGYSNLDRIVRYDVDVVKFDRFFILEAEKDEKVTHMLKHLSEAFRDLGYTLLYEGVETDDNEKLCLQCGADYIQGYKYSKPIPIRKLRDFFESKI